MHFFSAMLYVAMACSALTQDYSGSEWYKKSTLSTEEPVEFPGIVLEPGVYTIKLKEIGDRRSVVQILNQDETQVLATLIALPDHRLRPEEGSEFRFHEVRAGPRPIQTWYFPGDLVGLEFVYPKVRARQIAKESSGHVLASKGISDTVIVAVTPNGKEVVVEGRPIETARQKPR